MKCRKANRILVVYYWYKLVFITLVRSSGLVLPNGLRPLNITNIYTFSFGINIKNF